MRRYSLFNFMFLYNFFFVFFFNDTATTEIYTLSLHDALPISFSEDVLGRFVAYGWHTQRVEDGTDIAAIDAAIEAAKADDRPSIIAVPPPTGFGRPTQK